MEGCRSKGVKYLLTGAGVQTYRCEILTGGGVQTCKCEILTGGKVPTYRCDILIDRGRDTDLQL